MSEEQAVERPICESCMAFDAMQSTCRREPPKFQGWPSVDPDDWCLAHVHLQRKRVYIDEPEDYFVAVLANLTELVDRPSQHSASFTSHAADDARELIRGLLADLRGWESRPSLPVEGEEE